MKPCRDMVNWFNFAIYYTENRPLLALLCRNIKYINAEIFRILKFAEHVNNLFDKHHQIVSLG